MGGFLAGAVPDFESLAVVEGFLRGISRSRKILS